MAIDTRAPAPFGASTDGRSVYRLAGTGVAIGAVALVFGLVGADAVPRAALAAPDARETPFLAIAGAMLAVVGLLVAGAAAARRPKDSAVLGLAAAAAALAFFATHKEWDAIRIMMIVMAWVAAVAAVLVRLPQTAQRVAVSVLVLFHFAGILTAITSPPETPWLTAQLWARIFRPHLEFCYVNNAYQFYSPQPGPANV